jgi:F-type H+-transporting ATPase subunit b
VGALVIEVSEKVLRRELSDRNQQEKYINQLAEDLKLS